MSMTKMDNVCTYAGDMMTLDGELNTRCGYDILDALNAGNTALDILSRMELDLSTWEGQRAKELLEEWN